jgi:hypothetical protein
MNPSEEETIARQIVEDLALLPGKNAVVLLEDREDIPFWKRVLQEFAPGINPDFPFWDNTRGKGRLKKFVHLVSQKILLCTDSDNDAFHQTKNTEWLSPRRPFIYQTYAYSWENHLIHPENLRQDCLSITYEDYDFQTDFKEISESLHDWLMLWLFLTDENRVSEAKYLKSLGAKFSWDDFEVFVQECFENAGFTDALTLDEAQKIIVEFKVRQEEHLKSTEQKIFMANGLDEWWKEFLAFRKKCPIEPCETLWFIRGHQAFDDIILPYFDKIVEILSKKEGQNSQMSKKKTAATHRDLLRVSYRNCLSASQNCRFFREIKRDFQQDFPQ